MKYTRICAIPPNFLILLPIKPPRDTAVHSVDQESILAKTSLLLLLLLSNSISQELYTKHHDYHIYNTDILIQRMSKQVNTHKMYIFVNKNKFMYLYIYNSLTKSRTIKNQREKWEIRKELITLEIFQALV